MTTNKINVKMKPPHPGRFVRDEIFDELGLSIARAAEILKVRAATISDLVNEKSSLSPEMAMRLELAFDVKADTLLRMQAWYDSVAIRAQADTLGVERYRST